MGVSVLKVVTIVGARPQFIKAAAVSRVIRDQYANHIEEVLDHTGQHYDGNMSQVFFDELDIPHPQYNLEISGGAHGAMTGRMLEAIENVLLSEKPDWVLVYGDTNSTLAGALGAAKLHIPVAHVEAGLRSFNKRMPEEINRILSDHVSKLLFCPTIAAVRNLESEGIHHGILNVGDVMYDVVKHYLPKALVANIALEKLRLHAGSFALATCHRAENTDDRDRLAAILRALERVSEDMPVVIPLHPRTKKVIDAFQLTDLLKSLNVIEPLPYLEMIAIEHAAKLILTDSGGVQKEAFFFGVPCITLRDETEWVETVDLGMNVLCGANTENIVSTANRLVTSKPVCADKPYGKGDASSKIIKFLVAIGCDTACALSAYPQAKHDTPN